MGTKVDVLTYVMERIDHRDVMVATLSYEYERDGNEMVYTPVFRVVKDSAYAWWWVPGSTLSMTVAGNTSSGTWDSIGNWEATARLTPIRIRARDTAGIPDCTLTMRNDSHQDHPNPISATFTAVVTDPGAPDVRVKTAGGFVNVDELQIGGVVPEAVKAMNEAREWVEV